jgi:hypothetical protein
MVAMIESAFLTALVACIGSASGTSSPRRLAIRAVDLSAKVPAANEEDAPAKRASQLIQGNFVFHPPCGRKEIGRPELGTLSSPSSSFIRLTEDPELSLWVLILPPPLSSTPAFLPSRILLADSPWPRPDGQIFADLGGRLHWRFAHARCSLRKIMHTTPGRRSLCRRIGHAGRPVFVGMAPGHEAPAGRRDRR